MLSTEEYFTTWKDKLTDLGIDKNMLNEVLSTANSDVDFHLIFANIEKVKHLFSNQGIPSALLVMLSNDVDWMQNYLGTHPELSQNEQLLFNIAYSIALCDHNPSLTYFINYYPVVGELGLARTQDSLAHLIPERQFNILSTIILNFPDLLVTPNAEGKLVSDLVSQSTFQLLKETAEMATQSHIEQSTSLVNDLDLLSKLLKKQTEITNLQIQVQGLLSFRKLMRDAERTLIEANHQLKNTNAVNDELLGFNRRISAEPFFDLNLGARPVQIESLDHAKNEIGALKFHITQLEKDINQAKDFIIALAKKNAELFDEFPAHPHKIAYARTQAPDFLKYYIEAASNNDRMKIRGGISKGLPFSYYLPNTIVSSLGMCINTRRMSAVSMLIIENAFFFETEPQLIVAAAWQKPFEILNYLASDNQLRSWLIHSSLNENFIDFFLALTCTAEDAYDLFAQLSSHWLQTSSPPLALIETLNSILQYRFEFKQNNSDAAASIAYQQPISNLIDSIPTISAEDFERTYLSFVSQELALIANVHFQNYLFETACLKNNLSLAKTMHYLFANENRFKMPLFIKLFNQGATEFVAWFLKNNVTLANELEFRNIVLSPITENAMAVLNQYRLPELTETASQTSSKRKSTEHSSTKKTRRQEDFNKNSDNTFIIHSAYLGLPTLPHLAYKKASKPPELSDRWAFYVPPELTMQNAISLKKAEIKTDWFDVSYYSFQTELPANTERTTIVFASRLTYGDYPDEAVGGRVILLITREELSSTEENENLLLNTLMTPFRDVCVINRIQSLGQQQNQIQKNAVPKNEIGLIMTRRLTGFYLAHYFNLTNVLFIDDNISRYGIKFDSAVSRNLEWHEIYQMLALTAQEQDACCVGPRHSHPETLSDDSDSESNDENEEPNSLNLCAKVFYVRMDQVHKQFPDYQAISSLLTDHRKLWGSDIFFQLMLLTHNKIYPLENSQFLIERSSGIKHAALKTILPATEWLKKLPEEFMPGSQQQVCKIIQNCVNKNIERYNRRLAPLKLLNLKEIHSKREEQVYVPQPPKKIDLNYSITHPTLSDLNSLTRTKNNGVGLRSYQIEALQILLSQVGECGYIQLPPRTGKTLIIWVFIGILCHLQIKGHILLMTPQRNLVTQLFQDLLKYLEFFPHLPIQIGNVIKMSSNENDLSCRIIGMNEQLKSDPAILIGCEKSVTQLLNEYPDFMKTIAVTIADEAHKNSLTLLQKLIAHSTETQTTALAVSATIGHAKTIYRNPFYEMTLAEAYRQGVISPLVVNAFPHKYSEAAVNTLIGHFPTFLKTVYHPNGKKFNDTKNIVIVPTIAHAQRLSGILSANQIQSVMINSRVNGLGNRKDMALASFSDRTSQVNILILVRMLAYGATIDCDSVISLRRSKQNDSKMADNTYQAVARCLNNQSLEKQQSANAQIKVAAIVLLLDANIAHLREIIRDNNVDEFCQENYLTQQADKNDERPFRLVKVENKKELDLATEDDSSEEESSSEPTVITPSALNHARYFSSTYSPVGDNLFTNEDLDQADIEVATIMNSSYE